VAVLYPRPVQPGDILRVIAPSGPFDRLLFFRALGWLSQRYRVVWSRGMFERQGFLAGDDQRRLDELNEALRDPLASAIVAARGGYGATRICHQADFASLARYPKWCVGFSDFTALHLEASRIGISSLHAANLASLGRSDARAREAWIRAIEQPLTERCFEGLQVLLPGTCSGVLVGGNLSLLYAYAASGRLALPRGCLLFLEEINEAPYRIDRMLTSLLVGGHLQHVAGVCLGDLADVQFRHSNAQALSAVRERLGELGIPVLAGLPVGHGLMNESLPLGVPAELSSQPARLVVNPARSSAPERHTPCAP
jgi:muramoyltetrapeptide carboxypeptidase